MKIFCSDCKFYLECIGPLSGRMFNMDFSHSRPCFDFEFSMRKKFVLVHHYLESGFKSIVAFSDDHSELFDLMLNQQHFNSNRHFYQIFDNTEYELVFGLPLSDVKNQNLINICKNVAEYLSIGEYAMLKKSYFKASSWFDKAKNSASLASDILDNY